MGGVLAWESWSNRTNSKPEACDTGAPGAGAKRVSELCPLPPLRTHKSSSLLFDHPCARIKVPPFCVTIPLPPTYAIAHELLNVR